MALDATSQEYLDKGGTLINGQIPTQSAPTGTDVNSPVTVPIAPSTLTSSNTTSVNSPTLPSAPVDTTNYSGISAGLVTPPPEPPVDPNSYTGKSDALISSIEGLMGQDQGKAAYTNEVNSKTGGVNDITKIQNSLTGQINALNNNINLIPEQVQKKYEGTGATTAGIAPIIAGQQRDSTLKALSLKMQYDMNAGDLANAKDSAQQAIDLKYKDIETKIDQQTKLLQLYTPFMNTEQAKALAAKTQEIEAKKTEIASSKQSQTDVINYAQTNEDAASASKALALDPASPTFKQDLAAVQAGIKVKVTPNTEVVKLGNGSSILIDKITGKTIRNLGGGTSSGDGSIPSSVVRTVATGNTSTPVTGYTLQAGDDPYNIAIANGTDMATLTKLNPQVIDWHNLPVGTVLNMPNKDESWLNGKTPAQVQAYNSIPDGEKAGIKQLVNGDALLTDLIKSRGVTTTAQINKVISEAQSIDPNFSVNTNKQRYTYKTQFNNPNGKEQIQINAINTGLGHLAEFKTASDALGNKIIMPYNKLVNYLKTNTGDPQVSNLNTVITALSGELASVYKGGGAPTDQETEQWRATILSSFSKSQAQGVSDTTANLIANKLQSMAQTYKNVMGAYPESPIVNPDMIKTLQDAGIDTAKITDKLKSQGYSVPQATTGADISSDFRSKYNY